MRSSGAGPMGGSLSTVYSTDQYSITIRPMPPEEQDDLRGVGKVIWQCERLTTYGRERSNGENRTCIKFVGHEGYLLIS